MCVLSRVRDLAKRTKTKREKKTLYLVSVLSSRQNRVRLFSLVIYYVTTPHVVHRPAETASPTLLEMQMVGTSPGHLLSPNLHSSNSSRGFWFEKHRLCLDGWVSFTQTNFT